MIKRLLHNNIANILTLSRLLFTIILAINLSQYLAGRCERNVITKIILCFISIVLSDFFDGKIARKLHIDDSLGALLDVIMDVIYVFLMHILLYFHQLLPVWFLILITDKTMNYIVTSYILSKCRMKEFVFIRDPVGKIVSASYFFTPMIVMIMNSNKNNTYIIDVILGVIGCFGIASSIYRIHVVKQVTMRKCDGSDE
ncbi:CDP-alcohol phosphatidyltransferase family protein [Anaerosporobacter faecicola]|uniref:CDP-alcohol phosphatidyltransferase family protein n=1 Tax=Anaerosporobacter faecicola TaxID=2718714 RepID=UPI00143A7DA7|nr:CDP-alcohol phosphatidyltransferase family protein [Anaerosporobacter faecicola]